MNRLSSSSLQLPDRIRTKLKEFQRRVWMIKLCEGLLAAVFGLVISYLLVFSLDRLVDTPGWLRGLILAAGALGLGLWFPLVCHKWIWKSRKLEQVARILSHRFPRFGDHLLGVIELVNSMDDRGRSEALCRAALSQVDEETRNKDFQDAVPNPRHRLWVLLAGVPVAIAILLMVSVPQAGSNALSRWLMPWKEVDRYTFTQLDQLPDHVVVPLAEPSPLNASLSESSRWNPSTATAFVNGRKLNSEVQDQQFKFSIPPLSADSEVHVRIGDFRDSVRVEPKSRPEISSLHANIRLPAYLQRNKPLKRDIRGGSVTMVEGSDIQFRGHATRELAEANVDGSPVVVDGSTLQSSFVRYDQSAPVVFDWKDGFGLSPKTPLKINLRIADDAKPSLVCKKLATKRVILAKDTLSFEIDAEDDFGVKSVGLQWKGTGTDSNEQQVIGEKLVSAGGPEKTELNAVATFSPVKQSIEPQALELRVFVDDYYPDRERVYSPPYTVFVLNEEDHAIWMTRQLDEWYKQSLETYEREVQLFNENKALRSLSAEELDRPENRRRIEAQAAAEKAQAARLAALSNKGEELIKEASRNDQFNISTLENLAEMLRSLKDISKNRMPSVSDLLKKAAEQPAASPGQSGDPNDDQKSQDSNSSNSGSPSDSKVPPENSQQGNSASDPNQNSQSQNNEAKPQRGSSENSQQSPMVNDDKSNNSPGEGSDADKEKKEQPNNAPSISIRESSMDKKPEASDKEKQQQSSSGGSKLTLPTVTLQDNSDSRQQQPSPAQEAMEEALEEQEDLLAEFAEVAEELKKLIANLEGSTFVKRLKAMARKQLKLAKDVNATSVANFGVRDRDVKDSTRKRANLLAERQLGYKDTIQYIQDDLKAYSNRNAEGKYKTVLAEMETEEVPKQLQEISKKIVVNNPGSMIAHTELLADTLDRWAEQLVGPG